MKNKYGNKQSFNMQDNIYTLLNKILHNDSTITKENLNEILTNTPRRVEKAFNEILNGYKLSPENLHVKTFKCPNNNMIFIKNINFESICEHHLLPINGFVSIAYIPNDYVLGLSKFARIVDIFAHRLQLQEKMTYEICETIENLTNAKGVAVKTVCEHMCISNRGVKKKNVEIVTHQFLGEFMTNNALRQEFLNECK